MGARLAFGAGVHALGRCGATYGCAVHALGRDTHAVRVLAALPCVLLRMGAFLYMYQESLVCCDGTDVPRYNSEAWLAASVSKWLALSFN